MTVASRIMDIQNLTSSFPLRSLKTSRVLILQVGVGGMEVGGSLRMGFSVALVPLSLGVGVRWWREGAF